ncbi:hypothetical protein Gotur_007271 [Gossypium turneri]
MLRLRELTRPSAQASEILPGFVLALVGYSTDNLSTFLELKLHIVNRTSHLIRAMPNLCPLVAKNGFLMEESITQVTEKNVVVHDWSFRTQKAKGDRLKEGYISDLPGHMTSNARENNLEDLTRIWKQWYSDTRGIFTEKYGDMAHLIAINIDEQLIQAMEYSALFRVDNVQFNKIYVKEPKLMTFKKKLMNCVPWFSLRELVQSHPNILKRVYMFALAIYGLIVFPKIFGHIEVTVVDFFEKSLSSCRRKGEGSFIGCAQLLNAWIFSHFWKVKRTPFHMFSKTLALLVAYLEKYWPRDVTK